MTFLLKLCETERSHVCVAHLGVRHAGVVQGFPFYHFDSPLFVFGRRKTSTDKENLQFLANSLSICSQISLFKNNLGASFSFIMDTDNDFTFCQVGSSGNQDALETKKLASVIDAITIKNEVSNGTMSDQNGGSVWKGGVPRGANSGKQETVGSLSVTVIDASSTNEYSQFPKKVPSGNGGKSAKPAARAKVPFEKGYSQMDWLKLTRTHPDLAGLKGQSNKRLISMNEVKQHQKGDSMWTVLKGRVYNLSPYMRFHPGGVDILKKTVGKDCTSLFNKYHAWVNADFLLEKCLVGTLDDGQGQQDSSH